MITKIVDEYEYLVDRYKVKQIGFVIRFFHWWLKPPAMRLSTGDSISVVSGTETRCDRLDKETADLMFYGGCRRVLMGIWRTAVRQCEQKYNYAESERGVANAKNAGYRQLDYS